jgi:tight adherence protein B
MVTALILFFVALVMSLIAVIVVLRARHVEQIEKVKAHVAAIAFSNQGATQQASTESDWLAALNRWLLRVGLQIAPMTALAILLAVTLSGWVILKQFGLVSAIVWWSLAATLGIFIPQIRYKQKVNKLVSQIPLFIDQIIRGLATGRNVEGAMKLAGEDVKEPLLSVIARAQRNVDLGADLGDALRDAASFYDVKELHMLALAIHTSRVYGGSPRDMLESIVALIRQREQMQRELRAMTGETRVTAWVLGMTPSLIAGFTFWKTPAMFDVMLNNPSGRMALIVAGAMQAAGALLLWRMIKSI